jgi:hypothetical protein
VVTTDYRPRTDVERWQIQDRLALRLQRMGHAARPRFYEGPGGRLAFRIRLGWRPAAAMLRGLESIDEPDGASSA